QLGEEQFGRHTPVHLGTLGFIAWQEGDPQTALRWFGEAEAVTTRLGWREASRRWWVADQIEALLELGRGDEALRVLDSLEAERKPMGGRSLMSLAAAGLSRLRWEMSRQRQGCSQMQPRSMKQPEMPSGGRVRCSHSASSRGGDARSAPPATRSTRPSPPSRS